MATKTTRQFIFEGLEIIKDPLVRFVEKKLEAHSKDWQNLVKSKIFNLNIQNNLINWDNISLLKTMNILWQDVFRKEFSEIERSYINETLQVRNRHAHDEHFTIKQVSRALDSMSLLMQAILEKDAEARLNNMITQIHHTMIESQRKNKEKALANNQTTLELKAGLKSWKDIVQPYEDIVKGNVKHSEFAANLADVHRGLASKEYQDPVEFFDRTYLTSGISTLLKNAVHRLNGKDADPIIQLKTNFGGGKTHSLLALYHLAGGIDFSKLKGIDNLLVNTNSPKNIKRAIFVGTDVNAVDLSIDNFKINTIWGNLFYQIGGEECFNKVLENDKKGINPGANKILEILDKYGPILILIDELHAFLRQIYDKDEACGTFDNNLSFIQSLTEAVSRSKSCLLVASLPESETEIGSENAQKAFEKLSKVFGRMDASWSAATQEESYEIVKKRIFKAPEEDNFLHLENTVKQFAKLYRDNKSDFPIGTDTTDYERSLKDTFPIHPSLFQYLYNKWGAIEGFQRTRGVLRFVGEVVHHLWNGNDNSLMIMPGSIYLSESDVQDELIKYIGMNWISIIAEDVEGNESIAYNIDKNDTRLGKNSISRRIARAIFMATAPSIGSQNLGVDDKEILRSSIQPGENLIIFRDALNQLSTKAKYIHNDNLKYWFDGKASINSLALDIANRQTEDYIAKEIDEKLKKIINANMHESICFEKRIHFNPGTSDDIIDESNGCRLVILNTKYTHAINNAQSTAIKFAKDIIENKGTELRKFKNTIIFLTLDNTKLTILKKNISELLAWEEIRDNYEQYNIPPSDLKKVSSKIEQSSHTLKGQLIEALKWIIYPTKTNSESDVEFKVLSISAQSDLITALENKLIQNGVIYGEIGPDTLNITLEKYYWNYLENIKLSQLWNNFCEYLYMERFSNEQVLVESIRKSVSRITPGPFAYASNYLEEKELYENLIIQNKLDANISIDNSSLILRKDIAEKNEIKLNGSNSIKGDSSNNQISSDLIEKPITPVMETLPKQFDGEIAINSDNFAKKIHRIYTEIIEPIKREDENANIDITINISAKSSKGMNKLLERTLNENANNLNFSYKVIK